MKKIKGIILAGGTGSRLYPMTFGVSKQLLSVYDKPMIYNSLSVLVQANICEILIISTEKHLSSYMDLFGDGSKLGLKISYKSQLEPNGIAESFLIGRDFIGDDNVCLILGDNIFFGQNFTKKLKTAIENIDNGFSAIFGKKVNNPNKFGVINFLTKNSFEVIEKPNQYISDWVVCGLYFYTNDVVEIVKEIKPSIRGELEISDINNTYIKSNKLKIIKLNDNVFWSDTGTYESLIETSLFFYNYETKHAKKINCLEEIAYRSGLIDKNKLLNLAFSMKNSQYGQYLIKLHNELK